jgi:hypothetical protein
MMVADLGIDGCRGVHVVDAARRINQGALARALPSIGCVARSPICTGSFKPSRPHRSHPTSKALARASVAEAGERGRPTLTIGNGRLSITYRRASALVRGDTAAVMRNDTVVWLLQDQMVAALEREIDALNVTNGIADAVLATQSTALRDRILAAERAEEAEIERATSEGTFIPRRANADPRAVPGIQFAGAASTAARFAPGLHPVWMTPA